MARLERLLRPADPLLRERLASSWTVTLQVQTLALIARAARWATQRWPERCAREAEAVQAEFQHLLVQDGVVAGCGYFPPQTERANSGSTLPTPRHRPALQPCP